MVVLITNSISSALKAKVKFQDQIDHVSRIRDTLRIMQSDIHLAFHYRDLEKEIEELSKKIKSPTEQNGNQKQPPPPNTPPPQNPATTNNEPQAPRANPETQWVGSENKLNFVTLNNGRTIKNSRQADFAEVGYILRECKKLTEGESSSKCLWRRLSPIVDDDVTQGGQEVVLLEDISEFKIRYFGKGKQDWVSDWRSDSGGDAATKNNFPLATEISLTVTTPSVNGKSKKYSFQIVVPIHFPNNAEEDKSGETKPAPTIPGA